MLQVKDNYIWSVIQVSFSVKKKISYLIWNHHCYQTDVLSQIHGVERMESNLAVLL